MARKGKKLQTMIELLKREAQTVSELCEKTGLKATTIGLYLDYELKRKGYRVVPVNKLGQLAYEITERDEGIH